MFLKAQGSRAKQSACGGASGSVLVDSSVGGPCSPQPAVALLWPPESDSGRLCADER